MATPFLQAALGARSIYAFQTFRVIPSAVCCRVAGVGCRGYTQQIHGKGELEKFLKQKIQLSGPITVAEYMKTVLTSPIAGYYMSKDVFGAKGDFITSPEISQIFGELLGVWIVHEWMMLGSPHKLQVVELGPGRGTLAEDLLRVFSQLKQIKDVVSLHLVEVSPKMSDLQEQKLTGSISRSAAGKDVEMDGEKPGQRSDGYRRARSKSGVPVTWYRNLQDVPTGTPTCFIAHEFFDALPVHKIQKTERGWREVLVGLTTESDVNQLQFILSPTDTPTSKLFIQRDEKRNHVEICPDGAVMVQNMADRISQDGGNALIIDYGHDGTKGDTFRGFRNHKLHDVLSEPGTADLTADVDFAFLRRMVADKAVCHGPILQRVFLKNMGIDYRLQALLKTASDDHKKDLISGYRMLTDLEQMGERFKFFAILPNSGDGSKRTPQEPRLPTGFHS